MWLSTRADSAPVAGQTRPHEQNVLCTSAVPSPDAAVMARAGQKYQRFCYRRCTGTSNLISMCYAISAVLLPSKLQHSLKGMPNDVFLTDTIRASSALQALCSLKDCPEAVLRAVGGAGLPRPNVAPPLREQFKLPAELRQALCRAYNASQQAAISSALTQDGAGFTLVQVSRPEVPFLPSLPRTQAPTLTAWVGSPSLRHLTSAWQMQHHCPGLHVGMHSCLS